MGRQRWNLTREALDSLLAWLDTDRDRAARKYEEIRVRLIRMYSYRGCHEAEDLADETINRVAKKVEELIGTFEGEPLRYFYGVAHRVLHEYQKRKPAPAPPPIDLSASEEVEGEYQCLEQCLRKLPRHDREFILSYYQEVRHDKIEHRKQIASRLGVAPGTLRTRAHRLRAALHRCVEDCLSRRAA